MLTEKMVAELTAINTYLEPGMKWSRCFLQQNFIVGCICSFHVKYSAWGWFGKAVF